MDFQGWQAEKNSRRKNLEKREGGDREHMRKKGRCPGPNKGLWVSAPRSSLEFRLATIASERNFS